MSTPLKSAVLQRSYRPVLYGFLAVVGLMFLLVAYSAWSKTVITVTPKLTSADVSLSVTVGPGATADDHHLAGHVTSTNLTTTVTAQPDASGESVPAHAGGQVSISNSTGKVQPLTSGTRLQSENGIIVRTTKRVDVPAGGSVQVDVVADPLGADGNLPPGKFTIVALHASLQSKIYGTSAVAFTGGMTNKAGALSLDRLTAASNEAKKKIETDFGQSVPGTFKTLDPVSVATDPPSEVVSPSYNVTVTMNGVTVEYPADQVTKLVRQAALALTPDDQDLASIDDPKLAMTDRPTSDSVTLSVKTTARLALKSTSASLDPANFVNLDRFAITAKLLGNAGVKSVTVNFAPWWRMTASNQSSRISVILAKPAS